MTVRAAHAVQPHMRDRFGDFVVKPGWESRVCSAIPYQQHCFHSSLVSAGGVSNNYGVWLMPTPNITHAYLFTTAPECTSTVVFSFNLVELLGGAPLLKDLHRLVDLHSSQTSSNRNRTALNCKDPKCFSGVWNGERNITVGTRRDGESGKWKKKKCCFISWGERWLYLSKGLQVMGSIVV